MAGPNGGVWGNEVTVPEDEKLTQNTASYVKPAGAAENASAENTGGDDTENASSPTQPVVRLPDGTEVPVADYDPFAEQRQQLEQRESRIDGMMSVINGSGNNGDQNTGESNTGEQTEDVHPLLAENPLLEKIEISDEFMSDEDKANVARHNALVDYAKHQNEQYVKHLTDMESKFDKKFGALSDEVGDRFVRDDIAQATALTGVTEEEMVAASRATGVTDVKTLATIVAGEKAIQKQGEEAAAAAEAQREQEAGNITTTSQGTGGGNNGTQQKEGRGVENWRDPQSVGAAYKFGVAN